jgi:hypothetical protein
MSELITEIRRHWAVEFDSGEWDCNWAYISADGTDWDVIGPTKGEVDLTGCDVILVDGIEFHCRKIFPRRYF